MLTIKQITDDREAVIRGLEKKHFSGAREAIGAVLAIDGKRKAAQAELDALLSEVKTASKSIGALMKAGQAAEAEQAKARVAEIKTRTAALEEQMKSALDERTQLLYTIPNVPYDIVPEGTGADDNLVVKTDTTTPCCPPTHCHTGNWLRSTTSSTSTSA